MIASSHYGAKDDISGVTTWLLDLLRMLRECDEATSLRLHHFGINPEEGSLYQDALACGVGVSGTSFPPSTQRGVIDILEFLNREKPQVFLPQALPAPHFAAKLAGEAGLPWVFTLHSDDPEYWALAELAAPDWRHGVWVAVSEELAREARMKFPKADVRVIPCGVEIPSQLTRWNTKRFRIVYSGRVVEEQKRVSRVLDVLLEACAKSPHLEAVFLGDGAARSTLQARVSRDGMEGRIRFTGRLTADEVREELLVAQALVLMSDFEGLPVALLEAMACGVVPVVRNIRSGIPEVVLHGKTGYLVDDDPSAAASVLAALAEDPEGWNRMSSAGRALVEERYSQDVCLKKWLSLIDELKQRSTVKYPIPIPWHPRLPRFDNRLRKFDQRDPLWWRRIRRKFSRIFPQ